MRLNRLGKSILAHLTYRPQLRGPDPRQNPRGGADLVRWTLSVMQRSDQQLVLGQVAVQGSGCHQL